MAAIKQLAAVTRSGTGKGAARSVRREGRVPGVVYGGGEAAEPISLDFKELNKAIFSGHFLTSIFELEVDGRKQRVLPRDYQLDAVTDWPLHVDFFRLKAGTRLRIAVPVHVSNREASPGLKKGGAVNLVLHTVEVLAPGRVDPGVDHHRPHRHGLPRLGAHRRPQAARGLPGRRHAGQLHRRHRRPADHLHRRGADRRRRCGDRCRRRRAWPPPPRRLALPAPPRRLAPPPRRRPPLRRSPPRRRSPPAARSNSAGASPPLQRVRPVRPSRRAGLFKIARRHAAHRRARQSRRRTRPQPPQHWLHGAGAHRRRAPHRRRSARASRGRSPKGRSAASASRCWRRKPT